MSSGSVQSRWNMAIHSQGVKKSTMDDKSTRSIEYSKRHRPTCVSHLVLQNGMYRIQTVAVSKTKATIRCSRASET